MQLGLKLHKTAIGRLPRELKAALAAACTQRQAEAYRACKRRTGGSSKEFDQLLHLIWSDCRSPKASEQDRKKWEAVAEKLYHSKENQTDMYESNVECALESLLETNDALMNDKATHTIYAAHHAFMSIRSFLINPLGKTPEIDFDQPGREQRVLAHPLTKAEHQRQERDLFDVEQAVLRHEMTPDIVERLRTRAELEAHSFVPIFERAAM